MTLVRNEPARFGGLIRATADSLGLDPALVEKDYWAVEALRAVHRGIDVDVGDRSTHVQPIFKGGTSLSKAFGLIERFSEDVDLLVPVPAADPRDFSQGQRSRLMKAATESVTAALGIAGERRGGRRGVDLHWRYRYEPLSGAPEAFGVEPSVRVEPTVMGGESPRSLETVRSMASEHAETVAGFPEYDDLAPVPIETLAPERTLVEKLAMLHDAASTATVDEPGRLTQAGRHYYDVAMLLRADAVRHTLTADHVTAIAADADKWSRLGGYPFTPRPASGSGASPAFNDAELMGVISQSYNVALTWVWGEQLSLDDCLDTVKRHAELL